MSIKNIIKLFIYNFFRIFPLNPNKVLIFSYYGEHYSGSPKYISEYLINNGNYQVVWAFVDINSHDVNCDAVKYGGIKYYYCLATSGTVITNYRQTPEFKRRKLQKYIQTWHSSLRLKMIEKDAENTLGSDYIKMAKNDSKQITHLISGSKASTEIFERSFWYDGKIIPTGTPQCDLFFNEDTVEDCKNKVRNHYKIEPNKKIVLYAPTFRNGYKTDAYIKDFSDLHKAFQKGFNEDFVILARFHPHMIGMIDIMNYDNNVLQATDYDDPQELMCAADVLISDYSAIMFDYAVTKKPCFLYVPDLDNYVKTDRGLYFDIEKLPFVISKDYDELVENVSHFDSENYRIRINEFSKEIGSYDDGKACERVGKIIKGEI